jgi:hypothetical protein
MDYGMFPVAMKIQNNESIGEKVAVSLGRIISRHRSSDFELHRPVRVWTHQYHEHRYITRLDILTYRFGTFQGYFIIVYHIVIYVSSWGCQDFNSYRPHSPQ